MPEFSKSFKRKVFSLSNYYGTLPCSSHSSISLSLSLSLCATFVVAAAKWQAEEENESNLPVANVASSVTGAHDYY